MHSSRIDTQEEIMTGGGWSCPHEVNGLCSKINNLPCDPGMKGCVLAGRFRFSDEAKNRPSRPMRRDGGGGRTGPDLKNRK